MRLLRARTVICSPIGTWQRGDLFAYPDAEAEGLIRAGAAEAIPEPETAKPAPSAPADPPEAAALDPAAETAVLPPARRRRGARPE